MSLSGGDAETYQPGRNWGKDASDLAASGGRVCLRGGYTIAAAGLSGRGGGTHLSGIRFALRSPSRRARLRSLVNAMHALVPAQRSKKK